ncbi:hypothetical protein NQ315_003934 [Exocentrus adspersus]|uniref:Uncharacterized protein n=1 Tax=Exocentrus adspersus TaxID=1586481 RepID=A0AAV8VZ70_9CUCU|nr:hypothetical protein NQ315_003934 [Exocentrus adspersus]
MQMENVCRACLRSSEKLLPLTSEGLVQKIEIISSIQVLANDYYPSTICEECADNVNKFFCFRKVIINSDIELRERYETLKRTNFTTKPRTKERDRQYAVKNEPELKECSMLPEDSRDLYEDSEEISMANERDNKTIFLTGQPSLDDIKNTIAHLKLSKCNECGLTFTSRIKLYNHKRTVHIAPGVCNICGIVMRTDNLPRHVKMHSEGPATCKICGKVFKNPESLRGHLLIHKGIIYTCHICGKTARVKSEHHRHIKTHTDPEARKVMCTLCGKRVRDLKKAHAVTHWGTSAQVYLLQKRIYKSLRLENTYKATHK